MHFIENMTNATAQTLRHDTRLLGCYSIVQRAHSFYDNLRSSLYAIY